MFDLNMNETIFFENYFEQSRIQLANNTWNAHFCHKTQNF